MVEHTHYEFLKLQDADNVLLVSDLSGIAPYFSAV